ncbi:hypothetical protein OsJ_31208 [Oryza sativa Japonica Group]|uniref:Uncharacterized protein n=1 Tax=Oryza sativa subsp. japonica TaxID=39947 RepID=B9G5B7_ORYSJ|nr:hypothetical protein OsJ_31208 [Oryza sativa Japonica Group]KAF2913146.1 hypothetical protein DAI22_10g067270 [Oryza sativa Japonica Group]
MTQYIEVPAKVFLEEFVRMLDLGPLTITGRHIYSSTGLHVVGVQVNLGPADRVPYLYYEAAKTTVAEAEQTASLMAIHALAAERQIEIRDVNYPQVQHLRHQVARLRGRVVEAEKLCAELLTIVRSSENEVMFLERLTHRLYHRVRYLSETITVLQRGGGGSDSSSGSV